MDTSLSLSMTSKPCFWLAFCLSQKTYSKFRSKFTIRLPSKFKYKWNCSTKNIFCGKNLQIFFKPTPKIKQKKCLKSLKMQAGGGLLSFCEILEKFLKSFEIFFGILEIFLEFFEFSWKFVWILEILKNLKPLSFWANFQRQKP